MSLVQEEEISETSRTEIFAQLYFNEYVKFPHCGKLYLEESVQHDYAYLVDLAWVGQTAQGLEPIFVGDCEDKAWDERFIIYVLRDMKPLTFIFIEVATEKLFQVELENSDYFENYYGLLDMVDDKLVLKLCDTTDDEVLSVKSFFFDREAMTLEGVALTPYPRWSPT